LAGAFNSNKQLFAQTDKFLNWLSSKAEKYEIFAPNPSRQLIKFSQQQISQIDFNLSRSIDPIKSLFFPARVNLGSPFISEETSVAEIPERILIGARACDLSSLEILDYVFLAGELKDEAYEARRQKTIIISQDCFSFADSCFCIGLGGEVYPEKGFDLNLSPIDDGLIIEVGSEKGAKLISTADFSPATDQQIAQKQEKRKKAHSELESIIKEKGYDFRGKDLKLIIDTSAEAGIWLKQAEKCVECAGCNLICPTCHCFILSDWQEKEGFVRFQSWDSCQYRNFARVAGGANPRRFRYQRLRNRYEKKFSFFISEMNRYACVGCGRCVEACGGGIDIREVLKELTSG